MTSQQRSMPVARRRGDDDLWFEPSTLDRLAIRNTLWLQGRMMSRPGSRPGFGPMDIMGAEAERAFPGASHRLFPVWSTLAVEGLLLRGFTVAHRRIIVDEGRAARMVVHAALHGYVLDWPGPLQSPVDKLHKFASDFQYGILDRPMGTDPAHRLPGAPHVFIRGEVRPDHGLGVQRCLQDLRKEWPGINPKVMAQLPDARQITVYSHAYVADLWADIAGFFRTTLAPPLINQ